jgi:sugar phosphate isomerase/epimerase
MERLRGVVAYAAGLGVKITMEPLNRYETDFIFNAADGVRLIEDLACDNLGLMLDLFHMNIEDASIEEGLRLAGDRVWHVHIADSNRCYPGSGHIDFDSIFATLKDMGYQDYVSAELLPLPDPDTAARKTIEFLRVHVTRTGNAGQEKKRR